MFVILEFSDGLVHIHLLTVLEGNDECLWELPLQGLAKLVNLVVIFRGSYRIFKQSALLIAGGVRVTFQPSVVGFQTGTAGSTLYAGREDPCIHRCAYDIRVHAALPEHVHMQ